MGSLKFYNLVKIFPPPPPSPLPLLPPSVVSVYIDVRSNSVTQHVDSGNMLSVSSGVSLRSLDSTGVSCRSCWRSEPRPKSRTGFDASGSEDSTTREELVMILPRDQTSKKLETPCVSLSPHLLSSRLIDWTVEQKIIPIVGHPHPSYFWTNNSHRLRKVEI